MVAQKAVLGEGEGGQANGRVAYGDGDRVGELVPHAPGLAGGPRDRLTAGAALGVVAGEGRLGGGLGGERGGQDDRVLQGLAGALPEVRWAVDRAAGLPPGTTSAYFRTRQALLTALVRRLVELDQAELQAAGEALPTPRTPGELTDALTDFIALRLAGPARTRTVARYICTVESVRHPELRAILTPHDNAAHTAVRTFLASHGAPGPGGPRSDAAVLRRRVGVQRAGDGADGGAGGGRRAGGGGSSEGRRTGVGELDRPPRYGRPGRVGIS